MKTRLRLLFCLALALCFAICHLPSAVAQSVPIKNAVLQGTLNGTPTGGTLNLGSVTLSLGTPSSLTLTNATALPVSGITADTSTALGVGSLNIGHASDTTLARSSAGRLSMEGINIVGTSTTDALTNKTYNGITIVAGSGTIDIGDKVFAIGEDFQTTGFVNVAGDFSTTRGFYVEGDGDLTLNAAAGNANVLFGNGGTVLYNGGALGTPSGGTATNLTLPARSGTGGTSRTLDALLKEQAVSVKDYGATGDGTTDDTTAITRALAACISLGRNVLFFPEGTYKLTDEIVLGTGPENLTICGQNYSSKIVQTAANKDCFRLTGSHAAGYDALTIRDIWLSGPGAATSTKSGFTCEDVTETLDGALFQRVKITGFKYGLKLWGCSNSKIDSCAASANWVGYYIANNGANFANSLHFDSSPASDNTKYNIWVASGDCITFSSMDIVGTVGEVMLYVTGGYNILMNNARIEANSNNCVGLYVDSTNTGVTMLNSSIGNYAGATNVTSVRIGQAGSRLTMINSTVPSGGVRSDTYSGAIRYDTTISASILGFGSSQGTTVDCYTAGTTYYGSFGASQWVTDMQSSGFAAGAGTLGNIRRRVDTTGAETINMVVRSGTGTYALADIVAPAINYSDTAYLSTAQTFTGAKTFQGSATAARFQKTGGTGIVDVYVNTSDGTNTASAIGTTSNLPLGIYTNNSGWWALFTTDKYFRIVSAGGGAGIKNEGILVNVPQSLSGAGAVNITTSATEFTSTGAAQALTLANGTAGQIKNVVHTVDGGSGVLTPTTRCGYASITFTNVGDSVSLQYTATGWAVVGVYGATVTP